MKRKKELIIIGAGISGLSAGVTALLKGYSVKIFEKTSNAGGCCSGWEREKCYIDNCMHWLTGTLQHTKQFKQFKKIGALDETSNLYQPAYFYRSYYQKKSVSLYSNLEKTRNEMIGISPEDSKEINKFINTVEYAKEMYVDNGFLKNNLNKVKWFVNSYAYYKKQSLDDLSLQFKHPLLQKVYTDYIPGRYSSLSLIFAYAIYASGNGKIFSNGSLKFSENILKKFIELGGQIYYNANVVKINLDNSQFTSIVLENEQEYFADYCICTCNPFYLFDNLLPKEFIPKELVDKVNNKKDYPLLSSFQCAFQITNNRIPFKDAIIIEIPPQKIGTTFHSRMVIKEYSYLGIKNGKYVCQIMIPQNEEDYYYWDTLNNDDKNNYNKIKNEIGKKLQKYIEDAYPSLVGKINLIDTWTPLTYNSYFNCYHGSYMGFTYTEKSSTRYISSKIKGLTNIYLATIWQAYTGGLPIANKIGRNVIKLLK